VKRFTTFAFVAAFAAFFLATSGYGRASSTSTLRGTVGPGFTISLTKSGKPVTALRAGTYRITVVDRSSEHNFVVRRGAKARSLTTVAFTGTKVLTVKLTRGTWTVFCAPHASVMRRQFAVGTASAARPSTTQKDDRRGEPERGDVRHGEPEPGDDHGGR